MKFGGSLGRNLEELVKERTTVPSRDEVRRLKAKAMSLALQSLPVADGDEVAYSDQRAAILFEVIAENEEAQRKVQKPVLTALERRLRITLPKQYSDFLREIGPGDFRGCGHFFDPTSRGAGSELEDELREFQEAENERRLGLVSNLAPIVHFLPIARKSGRLFLMEVEALSSKNDLWSIDTKCVGDEPTRTGHSLWDWLERQYDTEWAVMERHREVIAKAIEQRRVLEFYYKGGFRLVHPSKFEVHGNLQAYQVDGHHSEAHPPPLPGEDLEPQSYKVAHISKLRILKTTFVLPSPKHAAVELPPE